MTNVPMSMSVQELPRALRESASAYAPGIGCGDRQRRNRTVLVSRPSRVAAGLMWLVGLSGGLLACAQNSTHPQHSVAGIGSPSDPAVIVSAALRHYLERDTSLASGSPNCRVVIDAGSLSEAVVARLFEFPVATQAQAHLDPNAIGSRDSNSGKSVVVWQADIIHLEPSHGTVIVRCRFAARGGFQDRVLFELVNGEWVIVEVQNQWVT